MKSNQKSDEIEKILAIVEEIICHPAFCKCDEDFGGLLDKLAEKYNELIEEGQV